jgi:RNA polymerase sigma-70 factor (ECF subfamily)
MSAVQHSLYASRPTSRRYFARKNSKRLKNTSLHPVLATGEQAGAAASASHDQELIQQAIAGNSEAQTRLFASYTPRLNRIAFNALGNKEDAEDAVQDGWCRAYSKLHTFEGRSSLSTWLTRIVINSALMIRRRNKHHFQTSLDDASDDHEDLPYGLVDLGPTPEETCRNAEMNDLLAQQIHRLPSSIRTAFLLRDVGEFTTAESMKPLGINNSALKSRVLRARRRLAQSVLEMLNTDRQRNPSFIAENCCSVNCSSAATPSRRETANDQLRRQIFVTTVSAHS